MSQVYIKNVQGVTVRFPVKMEDPDTGEPVEKVFEFSREKTDRFTGVLQDNGYTVVESEEFDALYENSKVFKEKVDSGKLIRFEKAPDDALTSDQLVQKLYAENAELRQKLSEGSDLDDGTAVADLTQRLEEADGKLVTLQGEYNGLQGRFNTLQGDFDNLKLEYEAYQKANPAKKK
jgi:hypothetical protein